MAYSCEVPAIPTFPDPWSVVNVNTYATFEAAIAALGSTTATLLIPDVTPVSASVTVPANITLWFLGSGQLEVASAQTVTINGPLIAAPIQIFAGSGTVAGDGKFFTFFPQWWGATGDGVTDDTTAVQTCVTAANAVGGIVRWNGTFLTTSSISNLHVVAHAGPGALKRGSTLFYPAAPAQVATVTNNLYVSPTGNDANDGLSSSEPRLTIQSVGNLVYAHGYGNVTWVIHLAAGTYTDIASFAVPFPTPERVQFLGPAVSIGTAPTAVVQSAGGVLETGWYFQNYMRVQVQDIQFKNFYKTGSPNANNLSIGLVADGRCELYTVNVWTDGCDQGIYVTNGSQIRLKGGRHGFTTANGCSIQFIRHGQGTVGYGGTAADVTGATGPAFIGGTYGVIAQEFSMVHTDYCYFSAPTTGVLLTTSRVNSDTSTYVSCTQAIEARLNSMVTNASNTFTTCTTDIIYKSGSRSVDLESTAFGPSVKEITVGATTSSLTPVTLLTRSIGAKELQLRGTGFVLRIYGEVVGTNDTKNITVTLGSTTLLNQTIAASTPDYYIEVALHQFTAASSQKIQTKYLGDNLSPRITTNIGIAEDMTAAKTLTVTHNVANASDTSRIGWIELEFCH